MRNARETTGTVSAANHHGLYNRAVRMRLRYGIDEKANRFAGYVVRCWLPALERITAPLQTVTECNHPRGCHTGPAN